MEKEIKIIIDEYKKTGHINLYVVGREGSGKTHLTFRLLEELCKELNIKPSLDMVDIINNITSIKSINIIETYTDSEDYKFKFNVLMRDNSKGIQRGFYRFRHNDIEILNKFAPNNNLNKEYQEKKLKLMRNFFK